MNFKAILKTVAHAALGGFGASLAAMPTTGPVTMGNSLVPGLFSAASSAISALSNSTTADPLVHAAIGAIPVFAYSFITGDHSQIQTYLPALISGVTSAIASQHNVADPVVPPKL